MIKFNAKKLAAVTFAKSDEETRYYLQGVFFPDGEKIAVATNGHMLTAAFDADCAYGGDDEVTGIFPITSKAVTAMKQKAADSVEFEGGELHVLDANRVVLYIEVCTRIDGTFPDWRRVLPKGRRKNTGAAFAHVVVSALCATAKTLGSPCYRMYGGGIGKGTLTSPHSVAYEGQPDVFSIVMPMDWRSGDDDYANHPDWITDKSFSVAKPSKPEPEPPAIAECIPPKIGDTSPWDTIQTCERMADGIYTVTTPGHGGIWLSDERLAEMPEYFIANKFGSYGGHWWEEDSDWAFVALRFPDAFTGNVREMAESSLRFNNLESLQRWNAENAVAA